jgi:hypothetical protein
MSYKKRYQKLNADQRRDLVQRNSAANAAERAKADADLARADDLWFGYKQLSRGEITATEYAAIQRKAQETGE